LSSRARTGFRKGGRRLPRLLSAAGLALALGLALPGAAPAEGFFGAEFEEFSGIPAEAAQALTGEELDALRGTYLGLYFSVTLSGFADAGGAVSGTLVVDASFGGESGTLTFKSNGEGGGGEHRTFSPGDPEGPAVTHRDSKSGETFRIQAMIGSDAFSGAQGVFQISQVPGSLNSVAQVLNINVVILQASETNLPAIRTQLDPLFGF